MLILTLVLLLLLLVLLLKGRKILLLYHLLQLHENTHNNSVLKLRRFLRTGRLRPTMTEKTSEGVGLIPIADIIAYVSFIPYRTERIQKEEEPSQFE